VLGESVPLAELEDMIREFDTISGGTSGNHSHPLRLSFGFLTSAACRTVNMQDWREIIAPNSKP
jgi:hypothetical protein